LAGVAVEFRSALADVFWSRTARGQHIMKIIRLFAFVLALAVLLPISLLRLLLGGRRKDMVTLPDDDPAMAQAIEQARAQLQEFRRLLAAPETGMKDFVVKARFNVRGGHEHIWVGQLEPKGSGFLGKLENVPAGLHDLRLGSLVDVTEEMITDWSYSQDGVHHGHFTTRALFRTCRKRCAPKWKRCSAGNAPQPRPEVTAVQNLRR
jgi:uncharacterized protein YegJ (DUF2314 family)